MFVKSSDCQQFLTGLIFFFPAHLKASLPEPKDSASWHQVEKNLPGLSQASSSGIELTVTFVRSVVCRVMGQSGAGSCV